MTPLRTKEIEITRAGWYGPGAAEANGQDPDEVIARIRVTDPGAQVALVRGKNIKTVAIAQGAPGTLDLVSAPVAPNRIWVTSMSVSLDATPGTVKFQSGTIPTDLTGAMSLPANGRIVAAGKEDTSPLLFTARGEKLSLVSTGSGAGGMLTYYIAP